MQTLFDDLVKMHGKCKNPDCKMEVRKNNINQVKHYCCKECRQQARHSGRGK